MRSVGTGLTVNYAKPSTVLKGRRRDRRRSRVEFGMLASARKAYTSGQ